MKIFTALLAVPVCLVALACQSQSPTDTQLSEALTNPSGPSFSFHTGPVDLGNGCFDVIDSGVTTRRGGKEVVGTDGYDYINCVGFNKPGSKGVTVDGRDGNDFIIGSSRADDLSGGKGCDRVLGGNGNDVVDGGQGNDRGPGSGGCVIAGGGGPNGGLFGQGGDDEVKGGMGNDFLHGGSGGEVAGDVCGGGKGMDVFSGTCEVCGDPDGNCP